MKKVGLFESVDHNDKEALYGKAITATKWLKILTIIGFIILGIITLLYLYLFTNADSMPSDVQKIINLIDINIIIVIILLAFILQVLTLMYIMWVDKKLKKYIAPNFVIAYMLMVLSVYLIIKNISSGFNYRTILNAVIPTLRLYFWYLVITNVKKTKQTNVI